MLTSRPTPFLALLLPCLVACGAPGKDAGSPSAVQERPVEAEPDSLDPPAADPVEEPRQEPGIEREHFVTSLRPLGGHSQVLWVWRAGSPGALEAASGDEPAHSVSLIGAGPGGITLRGPDKETLIAYLRAEEFYTQPTELGGDSRIVWVFRRGSAEAEAAREGREPTRNVTWIGAGPDGITLRAPDADTLQAYLTADEFYTRIEDLGDGWEVLWVLRRHSPAAAAARQGTFPGQHVTLVGAGLDGQNVCAPDRATALEYLAWRRGFQTHAERLGGDSIVLWVFRQGTPEATAARAGMMPSRNVSRVGAGPDRVTLRAPDLETLDAYMARL